MRRSLLSGLICLLITGCSEPERITPSTAVSACGAAHSAQVALDTFLADQTLEACLQYEDSKAQKVILVDGVLGTYEVPSDQGGTVRLWVMAAGRSANCGDLKWPDSTDLSCGNACGCSGAWCLEYTLEPQKQVVSLTKILQRSVETFNCQDDDCDGKTDEGLPSGSPCMTDLLGVCRNGVGICEVGDRLVCTPTIQPGTQPEVCNGRDDNCDGEPDNVPGMGDPCLAGVGACTQSGQMTCGEMGNLICSAEAGPAMAEVCNQVDDDCDGRSDEGLAGCCVEGTSQPCGVAVGACEAGREQCTSGAWGECVGGQGPMPETCDGDDNDCDGNADEEFDTQRDVNHCGGCQRLCQLDHAVVSCERGFCLLGQCDEGYHNADGEPRNGCECRSRGLEACNGLDDDCDGVLDEDAQCAPVPNADSVCRRQACQVVCNPGFQNLSGNLADGCEAWIPPDAGSPDAGNVDAGIAP